MCTELCSALLALNTKLGHGCYLSLPLGSLGSSFGRSAWTLGSRTRGLFVLGVGLWQKLKVDICALFTELSFFPRYCALVIYLSESSSQFCSPIPNSRKQLFNYLKAESMSSSYLLFFKEKKSRSHKPLLKWNSSHASTNLVTLFQNYTYFIHVYIYLPDLCSTQRGDLGETGKI